MKEINVNGYPMRCCNILELLAWTERNDWLLVSETASLLTFAAPQGGLIKFSKHLVPSESPPPTEEEKA